MAEAPSSSTATAAAPQRMAKRPSSFNTAKRMAAAGNERMERLRKFQDERARKRAEVRANEPKVPFYVGVYKVGPADILSLKHESNIFRSVIQPCTV